MRTIDLHDSALQFWGASDIVEKPTGVTPRRLPAWTEPQIPDLFTNSMVGMSSGVRLAFRSTTTRIELGVSCSSYRNFDQGRPVVGFDLGVDGVIVDRRSDPAALLFVLGPGPNDVDVEPGESSTIVFENLAPGDKQIEIWLPAKANVIVEAVGVDTDAAVTKATHGGKRWVHYGSSISHCMETDNPSDVWPAVAARILGADVTNLGLAGCCHVDQFVARSIRDMAPDVITLKLGINVVNALSMSERAFMPAVHGFLDTIREGLATTPVAIISPIFCPAAEDHVGPTVRLANGTFGVLTAPDELRPMGLTLVRIRQILAQIVALRSGLGDTNLHYIDGLTLFGEADIDDLPDLLHPNAAGYIRMGERFAATASALKLL